MAEGKEIDDRVTNDEEEVKAFIKEHMAKGNAVVAFPEGGLGVVVLAIRRYVTGYSYYRSQCPEGSMWLSSRNASWVHVCLKLQGVNPDEFLDTATVHYEWKKRLNQRICYPISCIVYNPEPWKPFPSRASCERFIENKIFPLFVRSVIKDVENKSIT